MSKYTPENELIPLSLFGTKEPIYKEQISHYTSIATLFKILRNKTFRLNRIDNVNDLEEKERLQSNDNYRRVFVSCFSSEIKESIPMWKIYTYNDTGVMIRIKFKDLRSVDELFILSLMKDDKGESYPIIKGSVYQKAIDWVIQYDAVEVQYSDTPIAPSTVFIEGEEKEYDVPYNFALDKSTAWKYEKELRYRAIIKDVSYSHEQLNDISCLYASINFDAIEKITVVFNPWVDKDDWAEIFKDYIKKLNYPPLFEFRQSSLRKKLR